MNKLAFFIGTLTIAVIAVAQWLTLSDRSDSTRTLDRMAGKRTQIGVAEPAPVMPLEAAQVLGPLFHWLMAVQVFLEAVELIRLPKLRNQAEIGEMPIAFGELVRVRADNFQNLRDYFTSAGIARSSIMPVMEQR